MGAADRRKMKKGEGMRREKDKRMGLQTKEGGRRETEDRRLEKVDAD